MSILFCVLLKDVSCIMCTLLVHFCDYEQYTVSKDDWWNEDDKWAYLVVQGYKSGDKIRSLKFLAINF